MWSSLSQTHGDVVALDAPHDPIPTILTFAQLSESIDAFAAGLVSLGLAEGAHVGLFSENSARWLVSSEGILSAGGVSCVRGGTTASPEELVYILQEGSKATAVVVQDPATLAKLGDALPGLQFAVVLAHADQVPSGLPLPVLSYEQVLQRGREDALAAAEARRRLGRLRRDSLASLVYTSGTTGRPKGVMLTHGNLGYQALNMGHYIHIKPGETVVSILPPW